MQFDPDGQQATLYAFGQYEPPGQQTRYGSMVMPQSSSMSRQEPLTRRAQPNWLASLESESDMLTAVVWMGYGEVGLVN